MPSPAAAEGREAEGRLGAVQVVAVQVPLGLAVAARVAPEAQEAAVRDGGVAAEAGSTGALLATASGPNRVADLAAVGLDAAVDSTAVWAAAAEPADWVAVPVAASLSRPVCRVPPEDPA